MNYLLWIKLIYLGQNGKALKPPCFIEPQFTVNLNQFVEEWKQAELTAYEMRKAVEEILRKFADSFQCPLGWILTLDADEESYIGEKHHFQSKEYCFSEKTNQTTVELSFVNVWIFQKTDAKCRKCGADGASQETDLFCRNCFKEVSFEPVKQELVVQ